jgi:hypothetical protein
VPGSQGWVDPLGARGRRLARPYGAAPTCPGNPCTGTAIPNRMDWAPKRFVGTITTPEGSDTPGTSNGSLGGIVTAYWGPLTGGGAGLNSAAPSVIATQATTIP